MRVIEYKLENFKDICSMADFYEILGLYDRKNKKWLFEDVRQLVMDNDDCIQILKYLQGNQKKQKDKILREMPKQLYLSTVNEDWTNLSPASIQKSKIYVYDTNHENQKLKNALELACRDLEDEYCLHSCELKKNCTRFYKCNYIIDLFKSSHYIEQAEEENTGKK